MTEVGLGRGRTTRHSHTQLPARAGTNRHRQRTWTSARLDVDYGDQEIFIWLIELLPSHQGHGIGGRLIRTILDEARSQGKAVGLNVLDVNRRAYALYRRLGFIEVRRLIEGPAVRIRMIAAP